MASVPFPTTLHQFQFQFATEEACQEYLARCRWPEGYRCPKCGNARAYTLVKRRCWQCVACRHQVYLTSGTVLHNTKTPLTVWFWAAYLMTTDKRGLSALLLQRQLGLGRYETAWMILHKLRRAMVNASREPLHGDVELDDTWIGAEQAGLRGSRQLKDRKAALVLAAVERRVKGSGRIRMEVIHDFTSATMNDFVVRNVAPGSTVYTDGLGGFAGLEKIGFKHVPRTQPLRTELRKGAPSVVPLVDRAIGNLQQWIVGTHHGVSGRHLQVYLDEFVFRFNRRRQPMAAFQTLLGLGSALKPTSYSTIRGAKDLSSIGAGRNPNRLGHAVTTG